MKKALKVLLIIISIVLLTGCNQKDVTEEKVINKSIEEINKLNIIINNKEYTINLEDNDTTKEFINILPLELSMNELNGNEKYVYLDISLKTNPVKIKRINKGDVMLFNDNCLVIFYKSFDTSYSYTKIGHINNLDELDGESIIVKIDK